MDNSPYLESLKDIKINPSDIPLDRRFENQDDAINLSPDMKVGDYISLVNKNDLSEVTIYRKTSFESKDITLLRWDGETIDTSWFTPKSGLYHIQNAEQLAGLRAIVAGGYTFEGEIIELTANIDLGKKEWIPIGEPYEVEKLPEYGKDFILFHLDEKKTFSGIFDGCHHTIYNLSIHNVDMENNQYCTGLFRALNGAQIKDIIFENVDIGSTEIIDASYSTLFGYAKSSQFINIYVNGFITGQCCSSIGGIAYDCSFSRCVNRATIKAQTKPNQMIVVGGFVEYIGLTSEAIADLDDGEPRIFDHCDQNGEIEIDATKASTLIAGQTFASTIIKKGDPSYSILIDHCTISDKAIIKVINLDDSITRTVFYGHVNGSTHSKNMVSGVGIKFDLLSGLVGKTYTALGISVVRVTASTKMDAMIIPGSVNTLKSPSSSKSFMTEDVCKITSDEIVNNLEPYYSYVKRSKI
jgi:hypothetical protein